MSEHEHPTVLVVEDDEQVRAVLASILQSAGYGVLEAAHGKAALSMLNLHQVQVAVSDLAMPEMEGLELIRLLHRMHPGVRIIAYSGVFGEDMLNTAVRLGASAALTKPFSPRCLLATVEALLQDGQAHLNETQADDAPVPDDEALSAAEIELTAFAVDAWQTDSGGCRKYDCADAVNAAVAFLRICRTLLANDSPRAAFSVLNQVSAACERAGLLLETYTGLEAELFRERLRDLEGEMRLAWERIEAALK
jgi:CheY-like chemotaxis protein